MESDQGVLQHVVSLRPAVDAGESSQYPSSQPTEPVARMLDNLAPNIVSVQNAQPVLQLGCMADFHPSIPGVSRHASLPVSWEGANGCRP